jgi:hypothetical protein
MVTTAIIGLTLTGRAATITVLALTQPTGTFVALQQPVGLPFVGLGFAGLFFYHHRLQVRQAAATAARDGQLGDDLAEGAS